MTSLLLHLDKVSKIFIMGLFIRKEIEAVRDISFKIYEKEIVSLVGESGSGKTTTAKMILRIEKPTSGKIIYMGRDIFRDIKNKTDLLWYRRNVQAVFQDPYGSFNPIFKIDRVLYEAFNLYDRKISIEEKTSLIREALKNVNLDPENVLGKYPHELSGGERQRIMIARALLIKPKLIIADEPVSMLDATLRSSVLKLLLRLRDEQGMSLLFITHDIGLAYYISDRILVMYKGRIVEEGTPDEILRHPQSEYTKRLISDVPLLYRKWEDI